MFERTAIVNDGSDRTIDLVQDRAGTTQIQNRYTHGGQVDEPLSLEVFDAGGTLDQSYTYHADHLGSIRFVTDSVGTIVNAYEYDSYGRPGFELEQVAQPFRDTGREWDQATELYHYRARQYDPETGRFLQEDPLGIVVQAGLGIKMGHSSSLTNETEGISPTDYNLNLYRYVNNNPLNLIDPNGLMSIEAAIIRSHKTQKFLVFQAKVLAITAQKIALRNSQRLANALLASARASAKKLGQTAKKSARAIGECLAGLAVGLGSSANMLDLTHMTPDTKVFKNCEATGSLVKEVEQFKEFILAAFRGFGGG